MQPSLLVVAGDVELLDYLSRLVKKQFSYQAFSSGKEGLQHLSHQKADIIIADYVLKDMDGISFLMEAFALSPASRQIITWEGENPEKMISYSHQARIDFFLPQPVHSVELLQAVEKLWNLTLLQRERDLLAKQNKQLSAELERFRNAMRVMVAEKTTELSKANTHLLSTLEEIQQQNDQLMGVNRSLNILATVDPLTGLFNRREFHDRLIQEWARFERHHRHLSVIMLDIDHFKNINDSYGHDCGDKVLKKLGGMLNAHRRKQDIICRYGGEEFIIILPETPAQAACMVAETLRKRVATQIFSCKRTPIAVRISLGVAGAIEHRTVDRDSLVKKADEALYQAKQSGRNRVVMFPPEPEK
ncbi:MAG: diguanylate cyclase [Deltaproteobacteria bacterium]|nr:diguanylate cyclase [Deltaproteobacteria bacterium]